ncbi:hypothetical protein BABINDRAFT_38080 [Babjeviella inositovora NRRL Y-12698]|uniref:t-SNARE coiled-coil homology domain-containing protein n=1 Tax=Babjeviella inositovora NRRL Y-12698 TaxID=984486 RepID=A0A1E3QN76_9ASCO|nr:uncharacterized protein BABINDRAFT_38080 [Babjeviella inositovora NRRL Y-12698]ODQ79159.1 hypothetical protein BABINDRAFT_38080 [Babjeviella inositovora NRRL Y-12698]
MSYSQEQQNDSQFNALAGKLATLRGITSDINSEVNADNALLDHLNNGMNSLLHSVKHTSSRLVRALNSGNNIWRNVGLALLVFIVLYSVVKIF